MRKRHLKYACWLLCLCLSACGWQLQGAHRIPERLTPLYLDLDDAHSAFAQALQARFKAAGVPIAAGRAQAQTVLRVSRDLNGHHVSSVSVLNEPLQYEVYYNIQYRLDQQGDSSANLLPPQAISLSRTMSYDKTLALAKQREELSIRDTLAEEIADQVLRRLSMLPVKQGAAPPPISDDAAIVVQ